MSGTAPKLVALNSLLLKEPAKVQLSKMVRVPPGTTLTRAPEMRQFLNLPPALKVTVLPSGML
jgi:hypothetical protein